VKYNELTIKELSILRILVADEIQRYEEKGLLEVIEQENLKAMINLYHKASEELDQRYSIN
jgi:hypothetical protein